jgi:hypothetical protein
MPSESSDEDEDDHDDHGDEKELGEGEQELQPIEPAKQPQLFVMGFLQELRISLSNSVSGNYYQVRVSYVDLHDWYFRTCEFNLVLGAQCLNFSSYTV